MKINVSGTYWLFGSNVVDRDECYAPDFENGQKLKVCICPPHWTDEVTVNNNYKDVFQIFGTSKDVIVVHNSVASSVCQDKLDPNVVAIPVGGRKEKEKCKLCELGMNMSNIKLDFGEFDAENDYRALSEDDGGISIEGNMLMYDSTWGESGKSAVRINYCPMCGRKLS